MIRMVSLFSLALVTACAAVDESNESISVMHGKEFSVALESLAPAGYTWQIAPSGIDPRSVTYISDSYRTNPNALIGASGTQTFIFKARKPGITTITLQYKRPWETKIVKKHTITLSITKRKKPLN